MKTVSITPIFRIFDEHKAREFYVDYLGFTLDWEHSFESDMPLYLQVSLGDLRLHLSEHYGDCSPGSAIRVEITGIEAFHQSLTDKKYKYLRPGLEQSPWKTKEVSVTDPFGNRITFFEPLS
ncbi:glyoxalase superfamily protein [Paenibacillus sp. GCM10023248]|uniref:glyoxalase superfamily protein n=1 Tax=Bacillales TaxID=1385 RepID=UPI0023790FD6|nr:MULTISPECIES: glyoxalase superfamily protein [Bacillales]MDD9265866.1 glyoxalase superfamily protein [Paenibacillus sp. MAHUQ-63]MDR6879106.1 putative glyoxalase superfamily protein PhnB [Bacillus sp. 3255]